MRLVVEQQRERAHEHGAHVRGRRLVHECADEPLGGAEPAHGAVGNVLDRAARQRAGFGRERGLNRGQRRGQRRAARDRFDRLRRAVEGEGQGVGLQAQRGKAGGAGRGRIRRA